MEETAPQERPATPFRAAATTRRLHPIPENAMKHFVIPAAAMLAAALPAQSPTTHVPGIAVNTEGNDIATYPFGRNAFRTQQLIRGTALGTGTATIQGISYRSDTSNSSGVRPLTTVDNVVVKVSVTAVTPEMMSTTFAANVTGAETTVYSGSVILPAFTPTPGAIGPFDIQIPFSTSITLNTAIDNLLIDIEASTTPTSATNGRTIDSALPGGSADLFGTPGPNGLGADFPRIVFSANAGQGQGRMSAMVPGGSPTFVIQSSFSPVSGLVLFGLQKLGTPLDLSILSMVGSNLYIGNIVTSAAFVTAQPPVGFNLVWNLPLSIPGNAPPGSKIYAQVVALDPAAPAPNLLGVVAGNAVELTIGNPLPAAMRQLNASNYTSTTGSFQYTGAILGGAVVKLDGLFN
jgi:hypothetical protein